MNTEPKLLAAIDLLKRTGASGMQLRYSDDEEPVIWLTVAAYKRGDEERHEVDAALDPVTATLRLCERLVDGGTCTHCHRPTGLDPDTLDTMPLDELVCWYQYDPELETFRRGCEGDAA